MQRSIKVLLSRQKDSNNKVWYNKYMENNQNQNPKHLKSFWPLVAVFVFAALVGGVIIGVAYSNILQDEVSSFSFTKHKTEKSVNNKTTTPLNK